MMCLAEHRPDVAHLKEQPLDRLVAWNRLLRKKLLVLFGEIKQHRAGLDHGERLSSGPILIDHGRNLLIGVDGGELGRELLAVR